MPGKQPGGDAPGAAPLFLESVKVKDGVFYNIPFHEKRIARAFASIGRNPDFNLRDVLPKAPSDGLYKMRLAYPFGGVPAPELVRYQIPALRGLKIIEDPSVRYPHKYLDRGAIQSLLQLCPGCDFILSVGGNLTDSSIANLVFENKDGLFTPDTYLLPGTKRDSLLEAGRIREKRITIHNYQGFDKVYFINAMIDLEDDVSVRVQDILA
jgi:4-amino-4-deoxychorismate lyase